VEKNVKNYWSTDQWRSQPKNLGGSKKMEGKMFDTRRITLFSLQKTPLKAQNDYIF